MILLPLRTAKGFEVNFYARPIGDREKLILVCASIDQPATLAREIKVLQDAKADFPQAEMLLITLVQPTLFDIPEDVTVFAARDWLLH